MKKIIVIIGIVCLMFGCAHKDDPDPGVFNEPQPEIVKNVKPGMYFWKSSVDGKEYLVIIREYDQATQKELIRWYIDQKMGSPSALKW